MTKAPDTEPRWLDDDQQRTWRAFLLGTTLLSDRLDEDLRRAFGMSLVEYEVLVRLSDAGGRMRMAKLADALAHSRSRVTHTVARMERDGLVSRCESTVDRRGVIAALTEEGQRTLERAAPVHVAGVRDYLIDLAGDADLAALGRIMDRVADRLIGDHPEREMR